MKKQNKRPRRTVVPEEMERLRQQFINDDVTKELEKEIEELYGENTLFYLKNNDKFNLDK